MIGTQLYTRVCQSNGVTAPDQNFYLLPDFLLQHASSLLCAEAKTAEAGSAVTLQPCDVSNPPSTVEKRLQQHPPWECPHGSRDAEPHACR